MSTNTSDTCIFNNNKPFLNPNPKGSARLNPYNHFFIIASVAEYSQVDLSQPRKNNLYSKMED